MAPAPGVVMRYNARSHHQRAATKGAIHMHVTTIGIDLAKMVFQVHCVTEDWSVAFNRSFR